jgi:hypothetical protein
MGHSIAPITVRDASIYGTFTRLGHHTTLVQRQPALGARPDLWQSYESPRLRDRRMAREALYRQMVSHKFTSTTLFPFVPQDSC